MFCDKPHINLLTALLLCHGFEDIVVCPGSRNGILVHNFDAANFHLHPATDERSAAFIALGLCLAKRRPVAICVTSGSALLNTIPAVAEAYFRQLPLLVISADRPQQWIGQLDGQTLLQPGSLLPYAQTYTIDEYSNPEQEHWNHLRINEALLSLGHNNGQPVHLNVPISEPLFSFNTPALPKVQRIEEIVPMPEYPINEQLMQEIREARFPVIVMGQYEQGKITVIEKIEKNGALLFLPEIVAGQNGVWRTTALEHLLPNLEFYPDLVIHIGGNLVNKQLKLLLRRITNCKVIRIEPTQACPDTFSHLESIVRTTPEIALRQLANLQTPNPAVRFYQQELDQFYKKGNDYSPKYFSDLGIMQVISHRLPSSCTLQIGNSSVIRNATYFFVNGKRPIFCNRGINGIEGSLSAAVGYAKGCKELVFSFIGDLSFFYDQNALWNKQLPANLRIVLFNNGGGQIFYRLPGLDKTPSLSPYIAASHNTHAKGIAESYGLKYIAARNYEEVESGINELVEVHSSCPILLEVFTHTSDNENELKEIKQHYKTL